MMRFSRRNPDRELERKLRAGRPEPTAEMTKAITDRVRPRRAGFKGGLHVPLGLAGGLSAIVLTVAIAFGGAPAVSGGTPAPAPHTQNAAFGLGGLFPRRPTPPPAAINQYGNQRTICVLGLIQLRLPTPVARLLVGIGLARLGSC